MISGLRCQLTHQSLARGDAFSPHLHLERGCPIAQLSPHLPMESMLLTLHYTFILISHPQMIPYTHAKSPVLKRHLSVSPDPTQNRAEEELLPPPLTLTIPCKLINWLSRQVDCPQLIPRLLFICMPGQLSSTRNPSVPPSMREAQRGSPSYATQSPIYCYNNLRIRFGLRFSSCFALPH